MVDISFSNETMQYINLAVGVIRVNILDCLVTEDKLIFMVPKGQLGAAIGIKAKNLEKLRKLLKKNIKFVEFDPDKERFIHNLCKPFKVEEVNLEGNDDNIIARVKPVQSDKSKLIGKDGNNIDIIRQLASRHHSIKDVQVT